MGAITHLCTLDTLGTPDTLNPGLIANPTALSTVDTTITLPRETPRLRLKLIPTFSTKLTDTTHLGTLATLPTPIKLPLLSTPNPRSKSKRSSPSNTRSNNLLLTPTLLFKLPPPNKLHLNKYSPHCTRDFTRP